MSDEPPTEGVCPMCSRPYGRDDWVASVCEYFTGSGERRCYVDWYELRCACGAALTIFPPPPHTDDGPS